MTKNFFMPTGAHVLVDGQFGSTGKGAFASWLAWQAYQHGVRFEGAISNAGPNSGHTFYHNGEKIVLKQLPTFAVKSMLLGSRFTPAYLSAGAVIDWPILEKEAREFPDLDIYVHRNAAVITPELKAQETEGSIAAVAGTRSGTGAAQMRKIAREPHAIAAYWEDAGALPDNIHFYGSDSRFDAADRRYFVEVSQGFSLGIHSQFYPKVTSRECTVMQGIADARIPAQHVSRVFMVARTFPIRVGDVDGHSSGGWYPDQKELSWDHFPGIEPERTTVTQRIRRIATFSPQQMMESIWANQPDFILWNFMNYLKVVKADLAFPELETHFKATVSKLRANLGANFESWYGWGPTDQDIMPF